MTDRSTAFSNGTMFDIWSANWCGRCLRDAPFRNMGKGSGCPILLKVLGDNEVCRRSGCRRKAFRTTTASSSGRPEVVVGSRSRSLRHRKGRAYSRSPSGHGGWSMPRDSRKRAEIAAEQAVARYGTACAAQEATGIPLGVLEAAEARINEAVST